MEIIVLTIAFFLVGAAMGSFINMLIFRVHSGESLLGRSYCDASHETLHWYDLVPVISFIIFRGKCSHCGERLSPAYPALEFISASLSAGLFYWQWQTAFNFSAFVLQLLGLLPILYFILYTLGKRYHFPTPRKN